VAEITYLHRAALFEITIKLRDQFFTRHSDRAIAGRRFCYSATLCASAANAQLHIFVITRFADISETESPVEVRMLCPATGAGIVLVETHAHVEMWLILL